MKKKLCCLLSMVLLVLSLSGCAQDVMYEDTNIDTMSKEDAVKEMKSLLTKIKPNEVQNPQMDIYTDDIDETAALADIDTFDVVVKGQADIVIEVAGATELTSEAPDDWLTEVAKNFNRSGAEIDGKSVAVSVRQITSGEVVTYVTADKYTPDVFIPSSEASGEMIRAKGYVVNKITDRIAGNTAGLLLSKDSYAKVEDAYGEVNVGTVLQASIDGVIVFCYTNPYTSSTGMNALAEMLRYFDESNPLSDTASQALLDYQKTAPPVAYTTAVLRNKAEKGIIDAMVMEEQAYINTPKLSDFIFVPFGIRHDHPVYTFEWTTPEKEKAAELFVDFCLSDTSQKLASDRGFNLHEDYKSASRLAGQQYLAAQSLWKQNKNGGRPTVAVFVCDISGSMKGTPLASLKESLVAALPYIGSESYIGLVSYSSDVTINLPIAQFDEKQRAYFSGEVKALGDAGATHIYDAVVVAMDMINTAMEEMPDATPLIIVLTDGEPMGGYTLNRVTPVIAGMNIPVYSIAYNYNNMEELEKLSNINEAATVRADSDDIVNALRNLFNVQL